MLGTQRHLLPYGLIHECALSPSIQPPPMNQTSDAARKIANPVPFVLCGIAEDGVHHKRRAAHARHRAYDH